MKLCLAKMDVRYTQIERPDDAKHRLSFLVTCLSFSSFFFFRGNELSLQILSYTWEMSLRPTTWQLQTQACTGIKQSLQQECGAYHGPVYLETMMMPHLSGR